MDAPSSGPPTSSKYVGMLVECKSGDDLVALETIRAAGNAAHVHDDTNRLPAISTKANDGGGGGGASEVRRQRQSSRGHELAFRVSTPERIRRKSEILYGEIRTMMERHDTRTGREREVQRRVSRASRVVSPERRRSTTRRAESPVRRRSVASPPTPLPDLHQLFEESRRAHLTEAQQQRTYFPSSSKPTAYSPKDPSTFSYRFQSTEPPPRGP